MQNRIVQLDKTGIEALKVGTTSIPQPAAHEVVVNIKAVSLNFLDLMIVKGDFPTGLPFPYTPGCDGAGIVTAVGEKVSEWEVGDRVALTYVQNFLSGDGIPLKDAVRIGWQTQGLMADYVTVPDYGLVKLPDSLSFEEAATMPVAGVTAWEGLINIAKIQLGQTVLVQGTGGVSMFALQIARQAGARVIATTSSDAKAVRLKELGADAVINYNTHPQWQDEVLRLTGGLGADVTLDVGGKDTIRQSLQAVKVNGLVCTAGGLTGSTITLDVYGDLNLNFKRIAGFAVGSRESFKGLLKAGIRPVIDKVFAVEEVERAFRELESGGHFGKLVVSF
ncbi:NAD(P)-dependent alcohol dehydrogenase [Chitinophaga sp. LS1]|uniref:zinc-dependent alcohol dehydrogenase family protein n=1 Tax=Chitinophaga sp. LS1 TaxID=3051176 RepID=UPI002AAB52E8|nr:NAD(P)-dependent alcohol dehydrogenase [Chitinophaga sp. LS1]WPV63979.1 NAD(P)-dependent alcohol dehydrogenase [Chitinophaga sp. LS1]